MTVVPISHRSIKAHTEIEEHHIFVMRLVSVVIAVLGYLTVGGFGYPKQPTFPFCHSPVCHYGANTGYKCHDGMCDYVCSDSLCHGAENTVFSQKGMQEAWGGGAFGKHGCYGGNCGYWSGCEDDNCKDFYDFKQCQTGECVSGLFKGYGCATSAKCDIVCREDVCHLADNYGTFNQPPIAIQQRSGYGNAIDGDTSSKSKASTKAVVEFLTNVHPKDLERLIESVPNIDEAITGLDGEIIRSIFKKLPNANELMKKLKPETSQYVISKLHGESQSSYEPKERKKNASCDTCSESGPGWVNVGGIEGYAALSLMNYMQRNNVPMYTSPSGAQIYAFNHMMLPGGPAYDPMLMGGGYDYRSDPIVIHGVPGQHYPMQPHIRMLSPPTWMPTMDTNAIKSMLLNASNLHQFVMSIDPALLQSALKFVPELSSFASSMDPLTLQSVIAGLPNIKDFVASMNPILLQWIISSTPNIDAILHEINPAIGEAKVPDEETEEPSATMSKPSTEMSGPIGNVDPKAAQEILSTVPSIPLQYANTLLNTNPAFVQYVVEKHQNLHGLLLNMNTQTLLYVAEHVPKFGEILSKMNSDTLEMVFDKLPSITKYLSTLTTEVVQALAAKVPSLAKHAPPEQTTESSTPESDAGAEVAEVVTTTVSTEAPVFTDKELEMVRSKIPLIDKFLKLTDTKKLVAMRDLVPDYPKFVVNLEPSKLELINSHLSNITSMIDEVKDELFGTSISKLKESDDVVGAIAGVLL